MLLIVLGLLGLCFGSFVNALVWRLHERMDFITGRSECTNCHHLLAPQDLIPIISWVSLRGRCRYCSHPISWQYPLVEIAVATLFVVSYLYWPLPLLGWLSIAYFILWLIYIVALATLFIYDIRWMLLPNVIVFPLIGLSLLGVFLRGLMSHAPLLAAAEQIALGAAVLGGFYWVLYTISKGKWVGYGDVKLGLFMGIVLGWQGALFVLFLANIIGFIFVVPGMLIGRLTRKSKVPFGPFLIIAFLIVGLFGKQLIDWYIAWVLLR